MATFSHKQSFEMFTGKFVISNNDGTIWTADCAEIISNHKPEYDEVNYPTLECKFPITRGFGVKKVKFVNLEKTSYTRGQFSNTFRRVDLISKNVEKLVK